MIPFQNTKKMREKPMENQFVSEVVTRKEKHGRGGSAVKSMGCIEISLKKEERAGRWRISAFKASLVYTQGPRQAP